VAERPTFYADRCLGKAVPAALRAAGARVEIHDDHFPQNAVDDSWIPNVTARGWVILTKDKNIRRPAGERETVLTAQARIITLSSGNMRGTHMAALFVRHLSEMEQLVFRQPPPFVAVLGHSGLQLLIPKPTATPLPGDAEPAQPE
jgi:predicted nuclease of predicted toxin-antitoxin system